MAKKKAEPLNERIRVFALGGLDEDGKNLTVIEIDGDIYVLECGIKFPDSREYLGIEYIIQDFTYLLDHQDRIKGIIITHGHDDIMGALPYLLKQIHADIYTSPLAARVIHRKLKLENITGSKIHVVKRQDSKKIGGRKVIFFPVTHAYPGAFGVAIASSYGYIVYAGEFIEDFRNLDDPYRGDFSTIAELGNEGIFILLAESKGSDRIGHTSSHHLLEPAFSELLANHERERVFISVYTQSVYRIQEIVKTCLDYGRKMVFYTEELRELISDLEAVYGYSVPKDMVVDVADFDNEMRNVVVIISGQGQSLFKLMSNIANNEAEDIDFDQDDLIVIASQVVPGVEREFKAMENDIYKEEGQIVVLDRDVWSMHASREDLKMILFLSKPKYYIPIKGEYRRLYMNSQLALDMGMKPSNIILLDNGQVACFENGILRSCSMELELHDTLIDGKENWDMAGVVLKDREILSTDGVIILAIGIDARTKKIINGPDIQTRGLVYLKDAEYITSDVAKILESSIEEAVNNHTYDNLAVRTEIREKVSKYLLRTTAKRPMVLPVILEINTD